MKIRPFGTRDIIRIIVTLIITVLVGVFVTPVASWMLVLAVGVLVYTLFLELLKLYLGIRNLRKKKFEIATI